ncbi:MAG: DoxX family protein, partial [Candidatus Omnitrophica bacterium]|nr:DoxX family protein [Candidatus Omnitrophota bacterium]
QTFSENGFPFARSLPYIVGYTELICSFLFFLGLFTRPVAFILSSILFVATFTIHLEGDINYPFLMYTCCIAILYFGGGKFSMDTILNKKLMT